MHLYIKKKEKQQNKKKIVFCEWFIKYLIQQKNKIKTFENK